jgi:hypothetical protein
MIAPDLQCIAVFDAAKANAELGIVDTAAMAECAVRKIANVALRNGEWAQGIWTLV